MMLRVCRGSLALAFFFDALTQACHPGPPEKYIAFFSLPAKERPVALRKFSIPDQIEIYLYATTRQAPPEIGLAYPLAANGRAVIPDLLSRLQKTSDTREIEQLFNVFEIMGCVHPELQGDEVLIRRLHAIADSVRDDRRRRLANWSIATIEGRRSCSSGAGPP
jgi:hypothetical protein